MTGWPTAYLGPLPARISTTLALIAALLATACGSSGPVKTTASGCGDACGIDAADGPAAPPASVDSAPETAPPAPDPIDAGAPETSSVDMDPAPIDAADAADASAPDAAADAVEAGPDAPLVPPGSFVGFSVPGGTFNQAFALQLFPAAPGVTLTYTLDNTIPTPQSTAYAGPIMVDHSMQVRVLATSGAIQQVATEVYLQVADDLLDFASNLPLVFLHSFAAVEPAADNYDYTPGAFLVAAPVAGTTHPIGPMDTASRAGFKVRGFTSRLADQHSFGVELWEAADGNDLHRSVLGMPAESDWVLYGPWDVDLSLMRNALLYALSNRIGRYAPRTRFVEVFVESEGRTLSRASYRGVYTLMEKVKRDPMRVNITHLTAMDLALPALSGGYIFKVDDHLSPGEPPLMAGGRILELAEPKSDKILPVQWNYLTKYIDDTIAAINGPGGINPTTNLSYNDYIDVDSWIDFHILNAFAKNADGLRVSSFFSKDRGGKLQAGPLWDLDRSTGANDNRVRSPEGWNIVAGTQYFEDPWWAGLFKDPAFTERYWKRWEALLATDLRSDVLSPLVFGLGAELSEAQQRHFRRWPKTQPSFGYLAEVYRLATWLDARVSWISTHLRTYTP
jgi:hypothetical protein